MTRHQDTTTGTRAACGGVRGLGRVGVAATAVLAATALLGGCGHESTDAAPQRVSGTAAPVEGDAPGEKSKGPQTSDADKPGREASSEPSGSSGGSGGGAAGGSDSGGSGADSSAPEGSEGDGDSDSTCHSGDLSASVGAGRSGAGQRNFPLILTNGSSRTCTVNGYPGMAFVDGAGEQVSVAPERTGAAANPVRLAPGASAWAPLSYSNPGMTGADTVTPDAVRITPPDEEAPLSASWPGAPVTSSGEASVPKIGPLTPGTGG